MSHDLIIYIKVEVKGSTMTRMCTKARQRAGGRGEWEYDRKGRNVAEESGRASYFKHGSKIVILVSLKDNS